MADMDVDMDIDLGPLDGGDEMQISLDQHSVVPQAEEFAKGTSGISTFDNQEDISPNKVHLRGLDDLSTDDIKKYSLGHFDTPCERVEWIDDTSANLVFNSAATASDALLHLTDQSTGFSRVTPQLAIRSAKPFTSHPESQIQIRIALVTDRKRPRAHETSRFYLMHPEHDPREQRRHEGARNGSKRGYRKRRYSDEEDRRRRRNDIEDGFDASMYDDNGPLDTTIKVPSSSRERRSRGARFLPRSRNRSASPVSRHSTDSLHHRRRTPPPRDRAQRAELLQRNREKELFPQLNRQPEGKDLFSNKLAAAKCRQELFPRLTSVGNHRRTDAFDAADETADLFAGKMPVPFTDGASEVKGLAQRITMPGAAPVSPPQTDLIDKEHNGEAKLCSTLSHGISIKGSASHSNTVNDLFPDKANLGKELFAERSKGRGAQRMKATDF